MKLRLGGDLIRENARLSFIVSMKRLANENCDSQRRNPGYHTILSESIFHPGSVLSGHNQTQYHYSGPGEVLIVPSKGIINKKANLNIPCVAVFLICEMDSGNDNLNFVGSLYPVRTIIL